MTYNNVEFRKSLIRNYVTDFIEESNRIEGIDRRPTKEEVESTLDFLLKDEISANDISDLVKIYEPTAKLRSSVGMDVRVGSHLPMRGGAEVYDKLNSIVYMASKCDSYRKCFEIHQLYEELHPYMDGNGRSGRALWLRCYRNVRGRIPSCLFLQMWYYNSLEFWRDKS